jgi:hypothetical protein
MASTSVVLPWSTCATIATLRRSVLAIAGVIVSVAGTRVLLIHGLASWVRAKDQSRRYRG